MQSINISQIINILRQLSADKLIVVYDFVSYLRDREQKSAVSSDETLVTLSATEYERLIAVHRQRQVFLEFAHPLGREIEQAGVSEETLMAELEETKREVFAEQYGQFSK